jgi:hypothetical protein
LTTAADSGLGQQLLNDPFRLFVFALAELVMSNAPLRVYEIEGGPIPVLESAPDRIVAIKRDRVNDPHVLHGMADVIDIFLKRKLGREHADNHQPLTLVLIGPRADAGERSQPIDTGVGAELDEDDLPAQGGGLQRLRVEPPGRTAEGGQFAFNW